MVSQLLDICEIAFGLIALCSAAVAAWFELRDRWQTDEDRAKTRASYGKRWEGIRDSGVLQLPERAIMFALDAKTRLAKAGDRLAARVFSSAEGTRAFRVGLLLFVSLLVGGAAGVWVMFGWVCAAFLTIPFCSLFALFTMADIVNWSRRTRWSPVLGLWTMACLFTAGFWLAIFLGPTHIVFDAAGMFILLPVNMFAFAVPLALVAHVGAQTTSWRVFDQGSWVVFGMATATSFFVTLCSLLIGNLVARGAWIPKTPQMLLSNVVFDGFTMVATFAILARAVGETRKYPIPVGIVIDVVLAALFACASLWLGLIGTEHALSIDQAFGVLIARSAEDAAVYAFGPYFWAMHTTFLPTLGYLALIMLFWIAKLVVLPVAKVLEKGHKTDIKPHSLMAGLFGFVGATSLVAAAILHLANNDAPNRPSAAPAQVVEEDA